MSSISMTFPISSITSLDKLRRASPQPGNHQAGQNSCTLSICGDIFASLFMMKADVHFQLSLLATSK